MQIDEFETYELVAELSRREGVERVEVKPHSQTVEIAVCENDQYPYDKMTTGPAIVLLITD